MIRKDFERLIQDRERVKDDLSLDGKGRQAENLARLMILAARGRPRLPQHYI
jgi:hypothetical protein